MLTTRLRAMFSKKGNGPWWLAVHLLEKGRQEGIRDVKVYNVVLKMIATCERMSEDKVQEMDRLFEQMTAQDGVAPEVLTYNHLIYGHSQAKNEEKAVQLLEEMVARGLEPDRRTMSSMIVAHSWGSVEDMRRVAAEMRGKGWQPTRRANSAMIGALRRVYDSRGIVDVAEAMLESNQTPTEASLVLAIKAASHLGRAKFAQELLLMHGKAKHRPQESLYVCVMVALRNASLHEGCLACWRQLVVLDGLGDVKLDDRTYNLALSAAVGAERWEEMEDIFDVMRAKDVEPTLLTWRSMVDVWSAEETGNQARLDRIFGSMERRGWRPSREVRLHAAMAYARSKAWPKAIAWFEPALAEDGKLGSHETEQLVLSLGGMGRYGEIRQVWARSDDSKDAGSFTANALLRMAEAARMLDDPDWALELHSAASAGGLVSRHMCQVVVRVLAKAGRLETAAHVLQQARPETSAPLEPPITRDVIVSAFRDLAQPAEVSAFIDELSADGCEAVASRVERTSGAEGEAALTG